MTSGGSLASLRACENAGIALGDELPPEHAGHIAARVNHLSWDLRPSQRLVLAELIDDLAHILHDAHQRP